MFTSQVSFSFSFPYLFSNNHCLQKPPYHDKRSTLSPSPAHQHQDEWGLRCIPFRAPNMFFCYKLETWTRHGLELSSMFSLFFFSFFSLFMCYERHQRLETWMHLEPQVSFFSLIILACISLIIIVYRTYWSPPEPHQHHKAGTDTKRPMPLAKSHTQYHHSTRLLPGGDNVHNGLEMHHSCFNPR